MLSEKLKTVYSGLGEPDIEGLSSLVQSHGVAKFCEVGVAHGATGLSMLGGSCHTLYAVDIWEDTDMYLDYINSVSLFDPEFRVVPIRASSVEAASCFKDGFFDLVFIDADHSYKSVMEDIKAWTPKVKEGGIIAGHDCEMKYLDWPKISQREIDKHKEDEKTGFTCHPGVIRALYDTYNDNYEHIEGTRIWYTQK